MMRGTTVFGAAVVLLAGPALGQVTRALTPDRYVVPEGERVALSVASEAGEAAWPERETRHFFVRSSWHQSNRDGVAPDADGVVRWTLDRPGVGVIGMDLEARTESTTGAALSAFLDERVAEGAARPAVGPGEAIEIRRVESFKTLVRVGEGGPGTVATDKTGQRAEIRTLMDPTRLIAGSDLLVRAYADYGGAPGGIVRATNLDTGAVASVQLDAEALGLLRIGEPGRWMLEFHHLRAPEEEGAWTLYSSTVTFRVPAEGER